MQWPLLLLVASCQGLAVQKVKLEPLPIPSLLVLTALDPPALQVEWAPVASAEPADPVMGYEVTVWELPPVKTYKYIEIDGVKQLVKELTPPKIGDAETPPEKEAKKIMVPGPLVTRVQIPKIKLNVIYEVRVRAYSKRQDGPLSPHMRVQLLDDEKSQNKRDNKELKQQDHPSIHPF